MSGSSRDSKFKLSMRTVLIVLLALLVGAAAGALTWADTMLVAQAVLVGIGVTALAITYFDKIIE